MVHFPGFAPPGLCIRPGVAEVRSAGFPHSEISGSKPVCGSPKLFAAVHVLHRLLAPRHPPHALSSFFYGFIRARPQRCSAWPARRSGRFELLVCFALTLCFRLSNSTAAPGGAARGRGRRVSGSHFDMLPITARSGPGLDPDPPCWCSQGVVGLGRIELPTSPLSGVRSSHLSYRPLFLRGCGVVELIGLEPMAS